MGWTKRSLQAVLAALALAAASLVSAAPAEAAVAAPWRWVRVDQSANIDPFADGSFSVACPGGYVPLGGGFHSPNNAVWLKRHYYDRGSSYVLVLHNWTPDIRPVTMTVWCANADDVGPITWVSDNFIESNNRAGGNVVCPDGYGAVIGGADWNTFGDRHVDFSGPTPLGDGWWASGTSAATNDTLTIEVGCIPNSSLQGEQVVVSSVDVGANSDTVRTPQCPAGTRVLTGGAFAGPSGTNIRDTVDRGSMYRSVGNSYGQWATGAQVTAGARYTAVALCIPQSIPNVSLTQVPPSLSTSSSGTFSFTASDPAGESLTYACSISFVSIPCSPGQVSFGPVSDGSKTLQVTAANAEGRSTTKTYQFTIDTTSPTVTDRSPDTIAGLTQEFTMGFSEPVSGVSGTTVKVFAAGSSSPVPGAVTTSPSANAATSATWTPKGRLVPGQSYTVQLSTAIADAAGWPLDPPSWVVRGETNVENTSPALIESWDPDSSSKASGGHYVANRTKGSRAGLSFKAPASGEVSLYGLRTPSGGFGDVYIDGVRKAKVSFYGRSTKRARIFRQTGLHAGSFHTLEVRVLGTKPHASKGTWVNLDSVGIGTSMRQETAFEQSFREVADAGAAGGSYDTISHTKRGDTVGGPSYRLTFRGTSIAVRALLSPGSGTAAISVDGVLKKTVSLHSAGVARDVVVFSLTVSNGVHTVTVVPVGTKSGNRSAVGIDRFVVG